MRTCHTALLLAVAMVLLSTGTMCRAPAPGPGLDEFPPKYAPAAAPGPGSVVLPPEDACSTILYYSSGCDNKTCHEKCFRQLKGDGRCMREACQCWYMCKPPPVGI